MLLKTRYSIDTWEDPNIGVLIEMIYIFSFVTLALRQDGGLLEPFDYEDETQTHALAESVEAGMALLMQKTTSKCSCTRITPRGRCNCPMFYH